MAENGSVIELTTKHIKCETSVPSGEVFVDGSGVGEVGAVVLNDRKLLAEDGMVVIVLPMSSHDHQLLCPPEIVTRGFVYVKESEELMNELKTVVMSAAPTPWTACPPRSAAMTATCAALSAPPCPAISTRPPSAVP